ncbi:unnamed protein product [Peniophora sp. CBMAI 1063]|nr:unnamed protein product [Peniophora sp. CBMAI 1063]
MLLSWTHDVTTSLSDLPGEFAGQLVPRGIFLKKHLCSGGQGAIYEATFPSNDTSRTDSCVVKVVRRANMTSDQRRSVLHEFLIHRSVSSHTNIVTCRGYFYHTDTVFGVLDMIDGGDLHYAISEKAIFWKDSDLLRDVFTQILDAVAFCHARGIAHLDLKPENVLCSADCRCVYITDFGAATTAAYSMRVDVGTAMYMAPEIFDSISTPRLYDPRKADLWSLGCIFVNMIGGQLPWDEARLCDGNFAAFLADADFLRAILPISAEANYLARRVLELSPDGRLPIHTLAREIDMIRDFFMNDQDLKLSSGAVRGVALLAACTKRDWKSREALHAAAPLECTSTALASMARADDLDASGPDSAQQYTTSAESDGEESSGGSLFYASESCMNLADLCGGRDNGGEEPEDEQNVGNRMEGFEDVSLCSPII